MVGQEKSEDVVVEEPFRGRYDFSSNFTGKMKVCITFFLLGLRYMKRVCWIFTKHLMDERHGLIEGKHRRLDATKSCQYGNSVGNLPTVSYQFLTTYLRQY